MFGTLEEIQKQILAGEDSFTELLQQRGRNYVFDETLIPTATPADLEEAALEEYFGSSLAIPQEQLLFNTRILARDEEGLLRPTVAGLLVFGKNPKA